MAAKKSKPGAKLEQSVAPLRVYHGSGKTLYVKYKPSLRVSQGTPDALRKAAERHGMKVYAFIGQALDKLAAEAAG